MQDVCVLAHSVLVATHAIPFAVPNHYRHLRLGQTWAASHWERASRVHFSGMVFLVSQVLLVVVGDSFSFALVDGTSGNANAAPKPHHPDPRVPLC
jgi:hypothetical protein